jgi:hypothetical protein
MGPVEGGDKLYASTTFQPLGEPQEETDVDPDAKPNTEPTKGKSISSTIKAANGQRVAFRLSRTKLQKRAATRKQMATDLAAKIKGIVEDAAKHTSFSTKEQDEAVWKDVSERTSKAEVEIKETVIKLNGQQYHEVLDNLPHAVKGIDPAKLFDLDKWISITTDAMTPILENLFETEGKAAAAEIGKPELNPLSDTLAKEALHDSIAKMSESYNKTTLATLEVNLGFSIPDIPMLAAGGFVTQPTLALIGESGPEAVIPLSSGAGAAGGQQIVININGGIFPADDSTMKQIGNLLAKQILRGLRPVNNYAP